MKKKKDLQAIFDSMETHISLMWHDKGLEKAPVSTKKRIKRQCGFEPTPSLYHPITIQWSEKGRGFGEYTFWEEKGKIYCDNECDKKETVKRILCQMVDQAEFVNN